MADLLVWHVGDRDPSISETITSDGVAVDLTGKTVKFKMRLVGSSALKVDAAATVVTPTAGTVRYDWLAADMNTAGVYLVWWEVTSGTKVQAVREAVIELRAHAPATNGYVELEELKKTLSLESETFADRDIESAILAASRGLDELCDRRFYSDADALQVRYYSPWDRDFLPIDDLVTLTTLKTDPGGDGTFEETWTLNTDFVLEPLNPVTPARPWEAICRHPSGRFSFPTLYPRSVQVTGQFGWTSVPAQVKQATTILAGRLLKRARETPFGVAGIGFEGGVVRIASEDPDVMRLLAPFVRSLPFL